MSFIDIALTYVARGWAVFPCIPGTKRPLTAHGHLDASKDEATVRTWWTKWPNANIGIACGASEICVLDIDHGLTTEADLVRFVAENNLPDTYIVRTGRRPDYGIQIYFAGVIPDVGLWKLSGCEGQIKSAGGYVMAAGSVHPDSKETYLVLYDAALAPIPEVVRNLRTVKPSANNGPMELIPEGGGRHANLMSIAGKLRNSGLDRDALIAALIPINDSMHEVPVPYEDVVHIAESAAGYPIPPTPPVAVFGDVDKAPETEDADIPEKTPRPRYPDEVWKGTHYGDFADMCTEGNYIPKKMFSESLRTVVGALVGNQLSCNLTGVNPRSYTIKIGPPGSGKGTSDEMVRALFCERWEGLARTESPLLFGNKDILWRSLGLGAQMVTPASAPGLMMALLGEKKKDKSASVNPVAIWTPCPRIITLSEEIRMVFANFANENTGAGLESVLCELFDRTSFTSTATVNRQPESGECMYSLLGGITREGWDAVFSKVESVESGFLSRVNIIATEECRTVAGLQTPDFEPLRRKLLPLIADLQVHPRKLRPSPSAMQLVDHWFSNLEMPEGISRARLNILAWRSALHLAWLHGNEFITEADADGGIKLAEYQKHMREWYAPPEGETRQARAEAKIRKVITGARVMSLRELRRKTNYQRVGVSAWDKCLKALVDAGEVRTQIVEKGGQKVQTVILLKQKD